MSAFAFAVLHWQHRAGLERGTSRYTWLLMTLAIAFYLVSIPVSGSWAWAALGGNAELAFTVSFSCTALIGPVLAIVVTVLLACTIFFYGAINPRLALRKTSVYGVAALLLAVAMAVVQGTAATQLTQRLGLPGGSGPIVALALVGLVFAPLRRRLESGVERVVERALPVSALAEAHRENVTVVFGDVSGYTELAAKDEPTALTLASLLHKESRRLAERHDGRLVKSIGDAVLLAFNDPGEAAACCIELREKFSAAAGALGLPVLPLHFGLHTGEVVRDQDGDIFGGTVNLAARLQGLAGAGEIVVSDPVATVLRAGNFNLQPLGAKVLKNVPAPVNCFLVS